jgi:hypothetical protein
MPKTNSQFSIATYRALQARVDKSDLAALLAHWEFGNLLLRERQAHGGKQLPHGRLAELCTWLKLKRRVLEYRMQFAEKYSKSEVRNALRTFGSWHEITQRAFGDRKPKAKKAEWDVDTDGLLFEQANYPAVVKTLDERRARMTREQKAVDDQDRRRVRDALDARVELEMSAADQPDARAA